jgi:hypothetical protein
MSRQRTKAQATALRQDLEDLVAAAEAARSEDREEAKADIAALRELLPIAKSGPRRTEAAAILSRLDDARSLRAMGAPSLAHLLQRSSLHLSTTTARRLIAEHDRAPASRTKLTRLAKLETQIRTKLRAADANAWDLGILYDRVAQSRLYRLTDHRTLTAWANATFPNHGHRTLQRYRRVAKSFRKSTVARFGFAKLELGLRYLDLTPANDRPAELARLEIPVPGKGRIPFAKITHTDLDRAVAALTTEVSTPKPANLPRGATATLDAVRRSFARIDVAEGQPKPTIEPRALRLRGKTIVLFTIHNLPQHLTTHLTRANAGAR